MLALLRVPLAVAVLLLVPTAFAADADFRLAFDGDGPPAYEGPEGMAVLVNATPGERYAWRLNVTEEYAIAEVRVKGGFDVDRPKQVLPLLDDRRFVPLYTFDVAEVDAPALVVNLTGDVGDFTYRLGIPGPTNGTLVLERDVTPPKFSVGSPTDVTHFSFYVETRTVEPALAELVVRPVAGGEPVPHPTPSAARIQRFPVQGLRADTEYEVTVRFEDWSGNEATGEPFRLQTLPEPERPLPTFAVLQPTQDEVEPGSSVPLRVRIESPESPVSLGGVRLFVDKSEVRSGFAYEDGVLTYQPPAPWTPGYHSWSVEATNAAGGSGDVRGSFTVPAAQGAPGPAALQVLAAYAAIALVLRRR